MYTEKMQYVIEFQILIFHLFHFSFKLSNLYFCTSNEGFHLQDSYTTLDMTRLILFPNVQNVLDCNKWSAY